jgi:mitochondrial import receptor subunit TOM70
MNNNFQNYILKPVEDETFSNSTNLNKWQIALLVGSPILIGAVAYYFYLRKAEKKAVNGNCNSKLDKSLKERKSGVSAQSSEKKNDGKKVEDKHLDGKKSEDIFSDSISLKNQGNKYFNAKKYESAIECYSKAIECCPPGDTETLATFYQNRAASHGMIGKYEKVIEDCTKAIELNKRYIKALQRRAKGRLTLLFLICA